MPAKVLHVIPSLDPLAGGPVSAVEGMTTALAQAGAAVEVLTTFRGGEDTAIIDRLKERGIRVTRIGPVRTPIGHHPQLKAATQEAISRNDLVHIHALWENVQHYSARAAQQLNKPYIITTHGMLDPWSLRQSPIRKKIYLAWRLRHNLDHATALHFTADAERASVQLPIKAATMVEPLGLDLSDFDPLPAPGKFRQQWAIPDTTKLLTFLGRIHPGKGVEYLVPALAKIKDTNAKLAIVGPDSENYQQTIMSQVESLGIKDRVIFTGPLSGQEKLGALLDADIFCLPSDHENFGIVVIEALACAVPVLISDQVKIYREIEQAQVGQICQTNVESVVSNLDTMLQADLPETYPPKKLRSFVHDHYDWSVIANKVLAHYQRLLPTSTTRSL